jgi:hypothetical protein
MYLECKHNIRVPSKGKLMNEIQMKRGSTAGKVGTAGAAGVALAAGAACCAPLVAPVVAPVLAWFGLSSLGMAATGWYVEIAAGSALVLGGFLLFRHRKTKNRAQRCEADGSCGCSV